MINKKRVLAALSALTMAAASSCGTVVEQANTKTPPGVQTGSVSKYDTEEPIAEEEITVPVTTAAEVTTAPTTTVTAAKVMRGNLYDSDGDLLMYSGLDDSGKEIRYTNDNNKVAFANVLNEMSEGLDLVFDEKLRTPNPSDRDGVEVGQSIQLTFDADMQNAIYNYMANMNIIGAAVVMRSDGSIAAQVSYPSYDPDLYYGVKTEDDLAWGYYGNKAFQNFPPGSCFKIMSEVISDKHGMYSLWDEGEWVYDGTSIVNWDHDRNGSYPFERSLHSAFVNSSNIFFARSFDNIGKEAVLADLDNIFHFITPIDCDFGQIHNNVEIYCNDDLRRTAFGQSYVLTCPLYLAALGREAAYGDMVRPFTLKNVVDTNDFGTVLENGSQANDVIGSIPAEYRQNLLDGMAGVASGLGIYVPGGYTFYAKTGTAETWETDFLYITGVLKSAGDDGWGSYYDYNDYNGSYIVVMQLRNSNAHGLNFASESASLYQGLVNCVVN